MFNARAIHMSLGNVWPRSCSPRWSSDSRKLERTASSVPSRYRNQITFAPVNKGGSKNCWPVWMDLGDKKCWNPKKSCGSVSFRCPFSFPLSISSAWLIRITVPTCHQAIPTSFRHWWYIDTNEKVKIVTEQLFRM